jgi:hypothetical protein
LTRSGTVNALNRLKAELQTGAARASPVLIVARN